MKISADFFAFARDASATARAAGVASLVCDYLHMDLTLAEEIEVESILSVLLDDPSPLVRRAMAEGLAREPRAPRHLVHALACDQTEIAAIVLQHAPQFSDAELAEIALSAQTGAQIAIARRAFVAAPVCAALTEAGAPCVLVELAANPQAELSERVMLRMMERAGEEGRLREALLLRPEASAAVRLLILEVVSSALSNFLKKTGWLSPERSERILRDAREKVIVQIGARQVEERQGAAGAALALVRHLRGQGQLTPALILRALVCGDRLMLAASMADLLERPVERVLQHLEQPRGSAFAALYAKAGLPEALRPVFGVLLEAIARERRQANGAPDRRLVMLALAACEDLPDDRRQRLQAFFGRLEAEAARASVRQTAWGQDGAAVFDPSFTF